MSEISPHLEKVTPHFVSGVSGVEVGCSDYIENRNFFLSSNHQNQSTSPHSESLQPSKNTFCGMSGVA